MTGMLASVASLGEARLALAAGVDIIDFKDPASGPLGAVPSSLLQAAVAELAGTRYLSAAAGDPVLQAEQWQSAVSVAAETGIDYIKIGLRGGRRADQLACIAALERLSANGAQIIVVLFADRQPDFTLLTPIAEYGGHGVMLDTADKQSGGLLDCIKPVRLREFVERAHTLGLLTGLAGSLRAADIPLLLPLEADYLGFRGALCRHSRNDALDPVALTRIRGLLPEAAAA